MANPLPSALALTSIDDGSEIVAATHRNNYLAIQAAVNALRTALAGGSAGQYLQAADGTDVQWATRVVSYNTLVDVVNTATETDILQAAGYTIPANALGSTGGIRVTLFGDLLYNNSNTNTIRLRVYLGGSVIWDGGAVSGIITTSAQRRGFFARYELRNLGATNSQGLGGQHVIGSTGTPTTGIACASQPSSTNSTTSEAIAATAAVDTTASQVVRVTAQFGTASANNELRVRASLVEFL